MLKIENLHIGFKTSAGETVAVDGITFRLKKGESLGLVGESGSGKSLTALSIMGLLPEQANRRSGSVIFENENVLNVSSKKWQHIRGLKMGMIFQEPMTALNPVQRCGKQVTEVICQHRRIKKKVAKQEVLNLFKKVRLPRPEKIFSAYPHEISGGQKQRIMIAMAIANKPELLIADEPTTALDVSVQKDILQLLADLQKETGMAILFISHDLAVVAKVAQHIAVMYKGRIVEENDVNNIFSNPKHPYTKGLIACRPPLQGRPEKLPTIDDFLNKTAFSTIKQRKKFYYPASGEMISPLLQVENLKKEFPLKKSLTGKIIERVVAVDHVSFNVFSGETLGLVGESGCGKTTLGRTVLRLIDPDEGKIFFEEKELMLLKGKALKKERKNINIVFQDPYSSLNPRMSIGRAIMEPMIVHKMFGNNIHRKEKVMELLEKTGLKREHYHRYPHEFSGGQRQRIVIARALALQPKFIVCDEAVSSLDVSVQAKVLNLLNTLKKEFGFTYIFISHDLSVVRYMSDRIMVMKKGKIVEVGDADSVFFHAQHPYTQQLIEAIPKGM